MTSPAYLLAILQKTILENPYIPQKPTEKQAVFLLTENEEVLFGGAGGPGKSSALLMAALQYVDVPEYAAIIMRRSYAALSKPGALISRAHQWLKNTPASWDGVNKCFRFPAGSVLDFGYMDHETDQYNYDSAEYNFIGIDELTQWPESFYTFMFGRKRRLSEGPLKDVPVRVRSATNPGRIGHEWVRNRFMVNPTYIDPIDHGLRTRVYIPAKLDDNPHIDRDEYIRGLSQLDPISREQILNGDWSARRSGMKFKSEWFKMTGAAPDDLRFVRFWDMAATEPRKGTDPDWTVGCLMGEKKGQFWIADINRFRKAPIETEEAAGLTAATDGKGVIIGMEQEPGASGVQVVDHYRREVFKGFAFVPVRSTGSKEVRATTLASAAGAGDVYVVEADWNEMFFNELELFPKGPKDDQVDAATGAHGILTGNTITRDSLSWL